MPSTSSLESQFQRGVLVSELKDMRDRGRSLGPRRSHAQDIWEGKVEALMGPEEQRSQPRVRVRVCRGSSPASLFTPPSSHTQLAIPGCSHLPEVDLPGLSSKSLRSVPRLEHRPLSLLTTSSTYPSTTCSFNPPQSFLVTPTPTR